MSSLLNEPLVLGVSTYPSDMKHMYFLHPQPWGLSRCWPILNHLSSLLGIWEILRRSLPWGSVELSRWSQKRRHYLPTHTTQSLPFRHQERPENSQWDLWFPLMISLKPRSGQFCSGNAPKTHLEFQLANPLLLVLGPVCWSPWPQARSQLWICSPSSSCFHSHLLNCFV